MPNKTVNNLAFHFPFDAHSVYWIQFTLIGICINIKCNLFIYLVAWPEVIKVSTTQGRGISITMKGPDVSQLTFNFNRQCL